MTTRIYGKNIEIDQQNVQDFWNSRGKQNDSLKAVLLGEDFKNDAQKRRNDNEIEILEHVLLKEKKLKVLDLGCGLGRWAQNLNTKIEFYDGIDFSKEFIIKAKKIFQEKENIRFHQMSVCEIDPKLLLKSYDLIISTGVLMYVNDSKLANVFDYISKIAAETIYIQESISIKQERLTLNEFESVELKTNYSAIYRKSSEYENYFANYLKCFKINKEGFLLDETTGARKETNAKYWVLKR